MLYLLVSACRFLFYRLFPNICLCKAAYVIQSVTGQKQTNKAATSPVFLWHVSSWHDQSIRLLGNSLRVEDGGGQMAPDALQKLTRTLSYLHFSALRLALMWAGQKVECSRGEYILIKRQEHLYIVVPLWCSVNWADLPHFQKNS